MREALLQRQSIVQRIFKNNQIPQNLIVIGRMWQYQTGNITFTLSQWETIESEIKFTHLNKSNMLPQRALNSLKIHKNSKNIR